ncbi:hypothetical protein EW145_g5639 [Phellinidium pouzarii]|uniref:Fungal-type protein kinase domain-containing protein n=1 Tax=Phellinidium pouzarii TaxID=167371 RepID=A0A4S4KZW9_9AGAM|nr:hypothetical protein EW145_g5639 [Phellinidium pouzarii]
MSNAPPEEPAEFSGASPMDPSGKSERPTTPPRSDVPVLEDTPPKRHNETTSQSFRSGKLDEKRTALIKDLGNIIPEVELDCFTENILPPLQVGFQPQEIVNSLKTSGYIIKDRWKPFEKDPKDDTKREEEIFDPLIGVFNSIVDAANEPHGHEQTLRLSLNPDKPPMSERKYSSRPDGCMVLKDAEEKIANDKKADRWWYDYALALEFKKNEANRNDNVSKQVYSMQHMMTIDPCRRFVFGITIENTKMRLWFSCRATILVSKSFNFITDHTTLTRVFLSLAFASKADLGWDPTIIVSETTEGRVYHFDVEGRKFDSEAVLSDFAADAIIGRATRAFRVIDPVSGEEFALKDVWVDDDRELEYEIYKRLLNDIEKKYGKPGREEAEKLLLTPEVHCKVKADEQEDHTCKVMMREGRYNGSHESSGLPGVQDNLKMDHLGSRAPHGGKRTRIHHRIHYRIVFKEVATPLYNVMDLREIFVVLKDCTRLLELMHGCGWVHRDISCGNVYSYNGRGRLGDLEYAKKKDSIGKHDIRTGTLDFMAVEVARSEYMFCPELDRDTIRSNIFANTETIRSPQPNFYYNGIHDMESLWWFPIWMMFFHDIKFWDTMNESQKNDRISMILELFPRHLDTTLRHPFLNSSFSFKKSMSCLPECFDVFSNVLDFLRSNLKRNYQLFEATLPTPDQAVLDGLYGLCFEAWDVCIEKATGVTTLVPVAFKPYSDDIPFATSTSKRKATIAPPLSILPASKVPRIDSPNT